jgi:hypothetical protein
MDTFRPVWTKCLSLIALCNRRAAAEKGDCGYFKQARKSYLATIFYCLQIFLADLNDKYYFEPHTEKSKYRTNRTMRTNRMHYLLSIYFNN